MAKIDVLEERVSNHIKFFWVVVAFGFMWLGALTALLVQTKSAVKEVAQAQANAPAQFANALLSKPMKNRQEASENLGAVAAVFQTKTSKGAKATQAVLKPIAEKLADSQREYPDLPEVWRATGEFINYKSEALVTDATKISHEASGRPCQARMGVQRGGWQFDNCTISLEDVANIGSGNTVNGLPAGYRFVNCVVDYHGGPIPDGPITFENSLFRFSVNVVPPHRGAQAIMRIAQSDDPTLITIPSA